MSAENTYSIKHVGLSVPVPNDIKWWITISPENKKTWTNLYKLQVKIYKDNGTLKQRSHAKAESASEFSLLTHFIIWYET